VSKDEELDLIRLDTKSRDFNFFFHSSCSEDVAVSGDLLSLFHCVHWNKKGYVNSIKNKNKNNMKNGMQLARR
jgi:hypothetical protein